MNIAKEQGSLEAHDFFEDHRYSTVQSRVTLTQPHDAHVANMDMYFLEQVTKSRNKFSRTW